MFVKIGKENVTSLWIYTKWTTLLSSSLVSNENVIVKLSLTRFFVFYVGQEEDGMSHIPWVTSCFS